MQCCKKRRGTWARITAQFRTVTAVDTPSIAWMHTRKIFTAGWPSSKNSSKKRLPMSRNPGLVLIQDFLLRAIPTKVVAVVNVNYLGGNGPKSPGVKNLGGWVDGSSIGSITVKIGKELPEKLKNSFSCFYNNLLEYLQLLWVVKMCLKNDRSIIKNYR